jgi:CheY-like chemotaxis protein
MESHCDDPSREGCDSSGGPLRMTEMDVSRPRSPHPPGVLMVPVEQGTVSSQGMSRVPATIPPRADTPLPAGLDGIRVLVVDDEPDARDLVAYVLETCGMEVRIAGAAAEALTALERFTPHVIVSDIGMPNQDGYMLIRAIRTLADPTHKAIPAIALTAFALEEDRKRALAAGFNQHMSKPVEPSVLVDAVVALAGLEPG